MKTMKRLLALLMVLALMMPNLATIASAVEDAPADAIVTADATVEEVEESTEAPTETPTETPTEAPTEAEVPTEADAEATEAPAEETVETTAPEAETSVSSAAAEEAEAVAEEETEPETEDEIVVTGTCTVIPDTRNLPSDEELFAGYVEQQLYGTGIATCGTAARDTLSGDVLLAYDALVPVIRQIASGERASTSITLGAPFTNISVNGVVGDYPVDAEVSFTGSSFTSGDLDVLLDALLADLPYELYWFNKTSTGGVSASYLYAGALQVTITFSVSEVYADGGTSTVNTTLTGSASATAAKAQAVVTAAAACETDYEKLVYYRDYIMDAVEYNHNYGTYEVDNNPWQIIYVFDGDGSTNVVCEGYSKAFQYLCDLTDFSTDQYGNEVVTCYLATGDMTCVTTTSSGTTTSGGAHMWNIVNIGGANYLVDVTNSDTGMVGVNGGLFLSGAASGSASAGYVFTPNERQTVTFTYDTDTTGLWGESILTLSASDYEPPEEDEDTTDIFTQADLEAALAEAQTAGIYYKLEQSFTLTKDLTVNLTDGTYYYALEIPEGVTLTIPKDVTLNANSPISIAGGSVIIEEGGTLAVNFGVYISSGTLTAKDGGTVTYGSNCATYVTRGDDVQVNGEISNVIVESDANTEAELVSALNYDFVSDGYSAHNIYVSQNVTLTTDGLAVQKNSSVNVCNNAVLTIGSADSAVTLTNNSYINVYEGSGLVVADGSTIANQGAVSVYGTLTGESNITGNAPILYGSSGSEITEDTFVSILNSLATNGGYYSLSGDLTITGDVEIPSGVVVNVEGSLTINGTLTINGQLSASTGSIVVNGTLNNNNYLIVELSGSGANLTVAENGTLMNNGNLLVGNGTFVIDGTYTRGERGSVEVSTDVTGNGVEKIGKANVNLHTLVKTEDELRAALTVREGYLSQVVLIDAGITLHSNLEIPGGIDIQIGYTSWYNVANPQYCLTVAEGVTLTNNGLINVINFAGLHVEEGAALVNNGYIWADGEYLNNGSFSGNAISLSQSNFEAGIAAAAAAGEVYVLTHDVTLYEDLEITSEVHIDEGGSLTVTSGVTLTIAESGHLIVSGGEMTVYSGAALDINYLLQVWGGGTLTLDSGADLSGVQADEIWINLTQPGHNTVTGIDESMLGAIYNPRDAAGIEAAYAMTDTYAHIGVYPGENIVLDRNITIPAGDDLNLMGAPGMTLTVPSGYTLTNDGSVDISAENRLEVLEGGALVNNGHIEIQRYAQLYYYNNTLTNNGTITGDGDLVSSEMSHADLVAALKTCIANHTGWVHESETRLEPEVNGGILSTSFGDDSDDQFFYLFEGGKIIVPSGTRLEVYNPLFVIGGQIIVEDGGTLYINGLLGIQSGTVYIAKGGIVEMGDNANVEGHIAYEGETNAYVTARWLDNDNGWYENTEQTASEGAASGMGAMTHNFLIFYRNTWDAENLCWVEEPIIPTENSDYLNIINILEDTEEYVRPEEPNAEYFVIVESTGTLGYQETTMSYEDLSWDFFIYARESGFYTTPNVSIDSVISNGNFLIDTDAEENAVYWVMTNPGDYTVNSITMSTFTWDEDYNDTVPEGEEFITMTEQGNGVYKFTLHPDFVDWVQYDWRNFNLIVNMTVTDGDGNTHNWGGDIWINPPELKVPDAVIFINDANYLFYDDNGETVMFCDYMEGYDEVGNEIWERDKTPLPDGVSYDLATNTMTLTNAKLERLDISYDASWTDEEGNFYEVYNMPNADFTLNLAGENTISNNYTNVLHLNSGINLNITGNGSLHVTAVHAGGVDYGFPAIYAGENTNVTIGDSAKVTAEVQGIGYEDDGNQAHMCAIRNENGGSLTVKDSAALTTILPEDARRNGSTEVSFDNYPGGYQGISDFANVTVQDSAIVTTTSLNVPNGGTYNQLGGTVNITGLPWAYRAEEYVWDEESQNAVSTGNYVEEFCPEGIFVGETGTVNINGGELNIDVATSANKFEKSYFHGIATDCGTVNINGGTVNITGAKNGMGIKVAAQYAEDGSFTDVGGRLTITGGTLNLENTAEYWMYNAINVYEQSSAAITGGTINADFSVVNLVGNTVWGDEATGNGAVLKGKGTGVYVGGLHPFNMYGGEMNLSGVEFEYDGETIQGNAWFTTNGGGAIHGGKINMTNGIYCNNMNLAIDGGEITITNDWEGLPAIENNLYLLITGGTVNVTTNGVAIMNNGTYHQMGGTVTATNTASQDATMVSGGSTLINDGTLTLKGGYYGIVQEYDFDLASDEEAGNESMLFVGAMDGDDVPTLNISNTKMGIYALAPVDFHWNANVNIEVEGEPINEDRNWPTAIFVESNTDGSGTNVSNLSINGGSVVKLTAKDTAGVDAMSKGIVTWYSPVTIEGFKDDDGLFWAPEVTINAEMAIYSASGSADEDNFNDGLIFKSLDSGLGVSLTAEEFNGAYIFSLKENDAYVGNASITNSQYLTIDEFIKGMREAAANGQRYQLVKDLTIDQNVTLESIVDVVYGVTLTIKSGAVVTIPENWHLVAQFGGTILVEAGGRVDNSGIFANDCGTITVNDGDDYAGYVHNEGATMNTHYRNGNASDTSGIPYEYIGLYAQCSSQDQMQYIFGIEELESYQYVEISIGCDVTLDYTMTIPANVQIYLNGNEEENYYPTLTVPTGAILVNNGSITLNWSKLTVDATLINNNALWLNNGSTATITGTVTNNQWMHVGYYKADSVAGAAGILNIEGTLDNYGYLNICPMDTVTEENGDTHGAGGIVNVSGTLNVLTDEENGLQGFVEHHGEMNVTGTIWSNGLFYIGGDEGNAAAVVNLKAGSTMTNCWDFRVLPSGTLNITDGTFINQADTNVYGTVSQSGGTVTNRAQLYLVGDAPKFVATNGAQFTNNFSLANMSPGGVLDLSGATYTHGFMDLPMGYFEAETIQHYFEGGTISAVSGVDMEYLTLCYEGADESTVYDMIAYANDNGYKNYYVRVVGDLTISAGNLLRIEENCAMPVMNGSTLTVNGSIVNLGDVQIGANTEVTVSESGCIYNEGNFSSYGEFSNGETTYAASVITNYGMIENWYTGTMSIGGAYVGYSAFQNDYYDGTLGTVEGVEISQQSLWTSISDGDAEAQLQEFIAMVQNNGYNWGVVWLMTDTHITEDLEIPKNVTIAVRSNSAAGYTGALTVDADTALTNYGYISMDSGSMTVDGTLNNFGGTVYVFNSNTLTVNNVVNNSVGGIIHAMSGTELVNNGQIFAGHTTTLTVDGTYTHGENAEVAVSYREDQTAAITGIAKNYQVLEHVLRPEIPAHDETTLRSAMSKVTSEGYSYGRMYVFNETFTPTSSLTIPENVTLQLGYYFAEDNYAATTMTVPVDVTLTNNGTIIIMPYSTLINHGITSIASTGAMEVDGSVNNDGTVQTYGTVNVDGNVFNGTTFYVYNGGVLTVDGTWEGYDPINVGGTIGGSAFTLTQDELETLLAGGYPVNLNVPFTLERDLVIDGVLIIGGSGELIVPNGLTLTVNGQLGVSVTLDENGNVITGGELTVQSGGKLINNGKLVNEMATISIDGTYTAGANSEMWTIYYNGAVGATSGIGLSQQTLVCSSGGESAMRSAQTKAQTEGYGACRIHIDSMSLTSSLTISSITQLILGGDVTLTVPAGYTLISNGYVEIDDTAALIVNGTVASGSGTYAGSFWDLTNGILTISGSGDILNYENADSVPWYGLRSLITSVKLGYGITGIDSYSFSACEKLESILIPRSVTAIDTDAFPAGATLKVYHNSYADTYATENGCAISYIHEMDGSECIYCDYSLSAIVSSDKTTEEKVEEVKNLDSDTLAEDMLDSNSGTADLIGKLEEATGVTVTVSSASDDAIVGNLAESAAITGAALNAEESVSEVKLIIGDAENTSAEDVTADGYDTTNGVLFSMTLDGASDAENLDVPVMISLPVPADIDVSKLVLLHYHGDTVEELNYVTYELEGTTYVSFTVTGFSDFAMVERETESFECNFAAIEVSCEAEVVLRLKTFIPDELLADDNAYVILTKNGKETIITASELREQGTDSKGRYVLEQGVASGEMTRDVTLQIVDGNGNYAKIVDYIDGSVDTKLTRNVLDYVRLALEKGTAAQKELMTALVTYGGCAQAYFGVDVENPAYNVLAEYGLEIPDLTGITADSITQEVIRSENSIGITQTTQQAYLDSAVYLRVYFVLDEGASIENYRFTLTYTANGVEKEKAVNPVYESSRDRYYVDITDIPAAYLDYMYKITVTNDTTGDNYWVSSSVMAWTKLLLQKSTNAAQINLGKAMYYYNQAANDFFNK